MDEKKIKNKQAFRIFFPIDENDLTGITSLLERLKTGTYKEHLRRNNTPVPHFDVIPPTLNKNLDFLGLHKLFCWQIIYGSFLKERPFLLQKHESVCIRQSDAFVICYSAKGFLGNQTHLMQTGAECFIAFMNQVTQNIVAQHENFNADIILVITKIDQITKEQCKEIHQQLKHLIQKNLINHIFSIVFCSAKTGFGCDEILKQIELNLMRRPSESWDNYRVNRFIELYNEDCRRSIFSNLFGSKMEDKIKDSTLVSIGQVRDYVKQAEQIGKGKRSADILSQLKKEETDMKLRGRPLDSMQLYRKISEQLLQILHNMPGLAVVVMDYYGLAIAQPGSIRKKTEKPDDNPSHTMEI